MEKDTIPRIMLLFYASSAALLGSSMFLGWQNISRGIIMSMIFGLSVLMIVETIINIKKNVLLGSAIILFCLYVIFRLVIVLLIWSGYISGIELVI